MWAWFHSWQYSILSFVLDSNHYFIICVKWLVLNSYSLPTIYSGGYCWIQTKVYRFSTKNVQTQHELHSNVNHRRYIIFLNLCTLLLIQNQLIKMVILKKQNQVFWLNRSLWIAHYNIIEIIMDHEEKVVKVQLRIRGHKPLLCSQLQHELCKIETFQSLVFFSFFSF